MIVELVTRDILRSRREGSCTAVMMCDIDHFKRINDRFGHVGSDTVLREVARRLQNAVRSYDIVGRYGGEEFLVALNRCHSGGAVSRAELLPRAIGNQPFLVGEKRLTVTISVGLALTNEFGNCSVDKIVNHADMVLYAAKAAGRNYVRVAPAAAQNEAHGNESTVLAP